MTELEQNTAFLQNRSRFNREVSRYDTRKAAYKKGWQDCYEWITNSKIENHGEETTQVLQEVTETSL